MVEVRTVEGDAHANYLLAQGWEVITAQILQRPHSNGGKQVTAYVMEKLPIDVHCPFEPPTKLPTLGDLEDRLTQLRLDLAVLRQQLKDSPKPS